MALQNMQDDPNARDAEKRRLLDLFIKNNTERLNQIAAKYYDDNQNSPLDDDQLQGEAERHARIALGNEALPTIEAHLNRQQAIVNEPDRDPNTNVGSAASPLPGVKRSRGDSFVAGLGKGAVRGATDPILGLMQTVAGGGDLSESVRKLRERMQQGTEYDPGNTGDASMLNYLANTVGGEGAGSALPFAAAGKALSVAGRAVPALGRAGSAIAGGATKVGGEIAARLGASPAVEQGIARTVGAAPRLMGQVALVDAAARRTPTPEDLALATIFGAHEGVRGYQGVKRGVAGREQLGPQTPNGPVEGLPLDRAPDQQLFDAIETPTVRPQTTPLTHDPFKTPMQLSEEAPPVSDLGVYLDEGAPAPKLPVAKGKASKRKATLTRKVETPPFDNVAGPADAPQPPGVVLPVEPARSAGTAATLPEAKGVRGDIAAEEAARGLLTDRALREYKDSGKILEGFKRVRLPDGKVEMRIFDPAKAAKSAGGGALPAPKFRHKPASRSKPSGS